MIKILISAGYQPVYGFALFTVVSSTCGESRPVYIGIYMVEGHGEGYFYPTWIAS
jgi:hypothetical protein